MNSNKPIDKSVRIGHVHLKVADLERALEFYCGVLGFETMVRFGREAAFVSAGGYEVIEMNLPLFTVEASFKRASDR